VWSHRPCPARLVPHLRHRRLLHRAGLALAEPLEIESFNARLRDVVLDTELFSSLAEAKLILADGSETPDKAKFVEHSFSVPDVG
jgi:hypothetical protein